MENLQQKKLVTRRSLRYTYYVSSSQAPTESHPTLLFLHGFPDSAHLWTDVVARLGSLPNQIIIPDCLGYSRTDKPMDTSLYAYRGQAEDLYEILEYENAKSTVIIGHDWGSPLAQRTYLHKPELFSGVVLLNTAYMVPSDEPFNLDRVNRFTEKAFEYPQFSYWEFLLAPDAPELVDNNLDRMWQALHGDVEGWMKKVFCVPNAMRNFLLGNQQVPLKEYAQQPKWKDRFMQQFKPGEFASSLQMYKATAFNVQTESDRTIPKENLAIKVPLLFVICTKDAVCMPEMMDPAKKLGLVPKLKEIMVDCAHWSPMEKPDEIAQHIKDFLADLSASY